MYPEQLAQRFHEIYEELAPHFGYETRRESAVQWDDVPEPNKSLMIAVCEQILEELEGAANDPADGGQRPAGP